MKNLDRKSLVFIVIIVVLLGFLFLNNKKLNKNNEYSIVYLSTGEVYVGKLSTMGSFELKDGYILQNVKDVNDPTKTNFQLKPVSEFLWAPKSLHLVEKNIIFFGLLSPDSVIAKKLAEAK